MTYSFGGEPVHIPRQRFCLFWAAQPHKVIAVKDKGTITNAYVSLEEFISWALPAPFVDTLMAGAVMVASDTAQGDNELASRLAHEANTTSDAMRRLHCLELQARITRMALSGWELVAPARQTLNSARIGGKPFMHFEKMLRYIGQHFAETITLSDVANAASVSDNYANTLFKKILGTTIKVYITNVRIYRAQMLLAETDAKILSIALDCGFLSLSSFYEAFQRIIGRSPAHYRMQIRR